MLVFLFIYSINIFFVNIDNLYTKIIIELKTTSRNILWVLFKNFIYGLLAYNLEYI